MGSAFSGPTWPAMAPIGLAVLASCLPGLSVRSAALAGWVFGTGFFGLTLAWLWTAIGPGAWVALTLAESSLLALAGAGMRSVADLRGAACWSAAIWTTIEVLRSSWPLGGLPWGRLAYSAPDAPWAALLPWFGVTGTGFVLALTATWAGLALVRAAGRRTALSVAAPCSVLAAMFAALAALPGIVPASSSTPDQGLPVARVGVVQGGVPGTGTNLIARHREVTRRHGAETARLMSSVGVRDDGLDFVIWPENSLAVDPERDVQGRRILDAAVAQAGVPLLAGVVTTSDDGVVRNQGVVWTARGAADRYTKQHLVPFGEYVPWRPLAERLSARVAAIERDMTPGGTATVPLQVGETLVADALCFDVAHDGAIGAQVRGGAEMVVVQTSNAMFLGTGQPEQQWTISRVRALESGRSVVVASVNGVSGAIAPDGKVITRLDAATTTSVVVDVPLRTDLTLAIRLGQIPTLAVCALGVLGAIIGLVTTRRSRRRTDVRTPEPVRRRTAAAGRPR